MGPPHTFSMIKFETDTSLPERTFKDHYIETDMALLKHFSPYCSVMVLLYLYLRFMKTFLLFLFFLLPFGEAFIIFMLDFFLYRNFPCFVPEISLQLLSILLSLDVLYSKTKRKRAFVDVKFKISNAK